MQITLPEDSNTQFNLSQLIRHLIEVRRTYIVIGQQHVALANHTKDLSLDFWLRSTIANNQDTAQATNELINQIVGTGLFRQTPNLSCPNTGNLCNGIELV